MADLGFRDIRVRVRGGNALTQIREEDKEIYNINEKDIREYLGGFFAEVILDPVFRK